MQKGRIKFFLDKKSFWAHSATLLLCLATAFQIVGCWGLWTDRFYALTQILLPVASFLLMVLLISLLGDKALWMSFVPFFGALAFYGVQAWFAEDRIVMMIGIVYCVLAAVLFCGTVFSLIRTKWLLVLLFLLPFGYRAFYRDVLLLQNLGQPVSFADGMREMSLLCALLAMVLFSLGMKKRVKERRRKETEPVPAPAAAPAQESAPAPVQEPAPAPAPENTETTETGV